MEIDAPVVATSVVVDPLKTIYDSIVERIASLSESCCKAYFGVLCLFFDNQLRLGSSTKLMVGSNSVSIVHPDTFVPKGVRSDLVFTPAVFKNLSKDLSTRYYPFSFYLSCVSGNTQFSMSTTHCMAQIIIDRTTTGYPVDTPHGKLFVQIVDGYTNLLDQIVQMSKDSTSQVRDALFKSFTMDRFPESLNNCLFFEENRLCQIPEVFAGSSDIEYMVRYNLSNDCSQWEQQLVTQFKELHRLRIRTVFTIKQRSDLGFFDQKTKSCVFTLMFYHEFTAEPTVADDLCK